MSATYDFDRLLESVLETNGPQADPDEASSNRALANARAVGQRRPIVPAFDRRAWPASRRSAVEPGPTARLGLLVVLVVLTLAFAGAPSGAAARTDRITARWDPSPSSAAATSTSPTRTAATPYSFSTTRGWTLTSVIGLDDGRTPGRRGR